MNSLESLSEELIVAVFRLLPALDLLALLAASHTTHRIVLDKGVKMVQLPLFF